MRSSSWLLPCLLSASVLVVGCQSLGPTQLGPDRSRYGEAIATSWREQMILNVVKVRYLDTPVYLDISSVISSYSRSAELSLAATVQPRFPENNSRGLGVTGNYSESPTVSYEPLSGERLTNTLLRPIPPETVFGLIVSGGQAEFLLRATCQSINGIRNSASSVARGRSGDPRFDELRVALGRIAQAGALSLRMEETDDGKKTWLGFDNVQEVSSDVARVKTLLGLQSDMDEFRLVFGARSQSPNEIAMLTRPLQAVIGDLASGVEVPPADLAEGRATTPAMTEGSASTDRLLYVHSAKERPQGLHLAVRYRDQWFWVDDRDLVSKRTLMFLYMFVALVENGTVPQGPLLTIPAR
ncbi:MAG: hypothetical protein KJ614_15010 [Gammaproteobacteria bacterium]|uniref:hypothetical protein n=1 Tax=Rhodoferax sp. TaxID=50421 RepID=UPI00182EF1FB|nr:hypothetical protein [Rhodoferax sp.]MBU3900207.1 hypothetical protein [Gammaproteobacteria bacterium]MBA3058787.1 hypothetical protein [Rhodoferax sp.]MBU3999531.1 hypothetical protein [Gammaproteobacteria bacterium]MBU4082271.1 hypothetical protein [Gammaproteobacteria bacterium]MBU4113099.1 hypothetical protein [Gammaproteobacteria bacterium]